MRKLEELVPPLEICKLIPKGEFEDSAFVWVEDVHLTLTPFVKPRRYILLEGEEIPAPTLEEIMAKIGTDGATGYCMDVYNIRGEWKAFCDEIATDIYSPLFCEEKSGSTAALKLWLELKGIDVQNSAEIEQ